MSLKQTPTTQTVGTVETKQANFTLANTNSEELL